MHGFLNIDKPAGMTSHDVVARVRRLAHIKRVGHAGTLDPSATGVLVVAIGMATRLIEYVQEQTTKRYLADIQLGTTTETDDAEGTMIDTAPVPQLDSTAIEAVLQDFRGDIMQVPPRYSALHHQGRRMHELARAGHAVDLPARPVRIDRIELLDWLPPRIRLDIVCSKGTYIRSLARDIGKAIGSGAHLHQLRRIAVGTFQIAQATPLESLESDPALLVSALLPPEQAVADWPIARLSNEDVARVRNGQAIELSGIIGQRVRAHGPDGRLLALLLRAEERWQPVKVFDVG